MPAPPAVVALLSRSRPPGLFLNPCVRSRVGFCIALVLFFTDALADDPGNATSPTAITRVPTEPSGPGTVAFDPVPDMSRVNANGYLARIMLDSPEDVENALKRAEQLFQNGAVTDADSPLAFVLHGPEVRIFFKDNYARYKSIVDLAARLSAFKVVDLMVCETRMGQLGQSRDVLPPFVETVRFGPGEVERLLDDENYVYF